MSRNWNEWTEDEIEYLERFYEKMGTDRIAKKLNRTVFSVRHKAQKLGYNAYVCEDLYVKTIAKCFNCDTRVINRWIEKYELPCRTVKRGQSTYKLISMKKFWKWAEHHKELIPWSKYERLSILPEPSWVDEAIKSYNIKNNRKPITVIDMQQVISLRKEGKTLKEIALIMNRTLDSVKHIQRKINKRSKNNAK